jgi:peptide/nickel transport system permease protein
VSLQDLIDHVLRRPIRATGQVATEIAEEPAGTATKARSTGGLRFYLRFFAKDKPALAGIVLIAAFYVWGFIEGMLQELSVLLKKPSLAWALLPSDPFSIFTTNNPHSQLLPPSLSNFPNNLFGTDFSGQSIFARMLYATPHDVEAPIIVVGSAVLIGMFLGTAAGYFGGWTDEIIMRLTDAFLSLPALILAITVGVLLGGGFISLMYALMLVWWPTYARFFRAQALTIRERGYVESSKLSGSGSFRILLKHIIPNSIDPIIAYMTLDFGTVILFLAALAFLGVGTQLTYPEWGGESNYGLRFFPIDWWWAIIPGIVIGVVVIAFTLVGDRLQDLISGRMSY